MGNNRCKNRRLMIPIILLFFLLLIYPFSEKSFQNDPIKPNGSNISAKIDVGPIDISSDSDFLLYASEGDGTAGNPYIIRDYIINVTGTSYIGLLIEHTSAHFIVRNCTILANPNAAALAIESIASGTGTAENNTILGGFRCITMGYSHGVKVIGNNLSNSIQVCLEIWRSNGTLVVNNILKNAVRSGPGIGVTENSNITLIGNTIHTFGTGIGTNDVENLLVCNNTIVNCSTGIRFIECTNSHIINCSFIDCADYSMFYNLGDLSDQNWIFDNHFINAGIYIHSGNYNQKIFHNVFEGSFAVHDSGSSNVWYESNIMEGNNWSDWVGIGDYSIPGTAGSSDIYPNATTSAFKDTDADGLTDDSEIYAFNTNWTDNDSDNDTLNDGLEVNAYFTDPNDFDTDDDGLTDDNEILLHFTHPNYADSDDDGLSDWEEVNTYPTDPLDPDSDDDLLPDGWEVTYSLNPDEFNDILEDSDMDGLNLFEEYSNGADPSDSDTDDDGLTDGEEVNTHYTDPNDTDSDDDLMPDAWEVDNNLFPFLKDANLDADADGLSNLEEYTNNTDPQDVDTDDDGLTDGEEVKTYFTDPNDNDSDDDSFSDGEEILAGSDPNSNISIPQIPIWKKIWFWAVISFTGILFGVVVPIVYKNSKPNRRRSEARRMIDNYFLPNEIKLMISYSHADSKAFHVPKIARQLEKYEKIQQVLYSEKDTKDDFVRYMDKNLRACDGILLFCSETSLNSEYVIDEWSAAQKLKKPVIPVFVKENNIPALFTSKIGAKFNKKDVSASVQSIYAVIKKRIGNLVSEDIKKSKLVFKASTIQKRGRERKRKDKRKIKDFELTRDIKVLISYYIGDKETFKIPELVKRLRAHNKISQVIYSDDFSRDGFLHNLDKNIRQCDAMLLFCTEFSYDSEHVTNEWAAARALKKSVIPVYIDESDIPAMFVHKNRAQFDEKDFDESIQRIYNVLKFLLGEPVYHKEVKKRGKRGEKKDRKIPQEIKPDTGVDVKADSDSSPKGKTDDEDYDLE